MERNSSLEAKSPHAVGAQKVQESVSAMNTDFLCQKMKARSRETGRSRLGSAFADPLISGDVCNRSQVFWSEKLRCSILVLRLL